MPTYKPYPYKGFGGGLNLRDGVEAVEPDQAIDGLNVLHVSRDSVSQRSGYAKLTAAEGTNRYDSGTAFYKADGTKQLVVGAGNRLEALSSTGVLLSSSSSPTASPHYFQRFGGPTAEHVYIANGVDTVRRWTGAAFETPSYVGTTPTGRFLGLSVTDNRLVSARFPGAVAGNNPSTVRFSAEGDPLTWGATHYVDVTPGDGEEIMGISTWRDLVIVFKQTKFFVFYGNSLDDDGDPIFNYRPVDAGAGLVSSRAKAVAEQGVYFLDRAGIYFTSGTQPARVSELVEPIFHGGASLYYTGGLLNASVIQQATMAYHDERLILSFPSGVSSVNDRNLIFDPQEKWWSLANFPAGPMFSFRPASAEELIFGYSSGLKHLGRYVEGAYTADDMSTSGAGGVAIESRWQGGWLNYGTAAVKTIREAKISGRGQVVVSLYHDYRQTPSVALTRELSPPGAIYDAGVLYDLSGARYGPSNIVSTAALRKAVRGETFSLGLSNSVLNRSFKVHRFTAHLREARVPSVVKVS